MIRKAITFFVLVMSPLTVAALPGEQAPADRAKLRRLEVVGCDAVDAERVRQWLDLTTGAAISAAEVQRRAEVVVQRLQASGFYFARIDSLGFEYTRDSSEVDVTVHVTEGGLVRLHTVQVMNADSQALEVAAELQSRQGQIFDPNRLEQDIVDIVRRYEQQGHPFCQVSLEQMQVRRLNDGELGLDILLRVEPGPWVTIGQIEIIGNKHTRDYVIRRELGLQAGDRYDPQEFDAIRRRLMRLGYFRWVNPPRLEMLRDGTGKLIVELQEGTTNRFDGVIGYNPATATSEGFVTGLLDVSFGNLLGTGRVVQARWERRSQTTQELQFRYLEPWVAGWPLHAGFTFQQRIQDTTYVERELSLDLRVRLSDQLSVFSRFSKRDVTPDSLGVALLGIPESSTLNLAAGLVFDSRDDLLNPRSGLRYETAFELGRKRIDPLLAEDGAPASETFEQKRVTLDFESYLTLFGPHVLAVALHGRQVTSDERVIPITDQYRFGGARTLRGYREDQFRGSRVAWANLEYRYLLGPRSRIFLFVDFGYFTRDDLVDDAVFSLSGDQVGYGLGLRIDTRLGFFGIDYGLGQGDGLSNGKVHVGLINDF